MVLTQLGVEGQGAGVLVDVGVVACKPGEPQHQLEVGELDDVQGNVLRVYTMNAESGGNKMCDRGCRTAINELQEDRV